MIQKPYPYDPKNLEAEVSAVIKIKDIEELYELKERVSIKWWETVLILLLFASGFGFILTVSKLIPISQPFVYWFSLFWIVAIILTLIACIEFLIAKFRALRRLYEIHTHILEGMQKEIGEIKKHIPSDPSLSKKHQEQNLEKM
jgi:uncharacterized membrane protein YcjF (UPF0283 family)